MTWTGLASETGACSACSTYAEFIKHEVCQVVCVLGIEEEEIATTVEDVVVVALLGDRLNGFEDALLNRTKRLLFLPKQLAFGPKVAATKLHHFGAARLNLGQLALAVFRRVEQFTGFVFLLQRSDLLRQAIEFSLPFCSGTVYLLAGGLVFRQLPQNDVGVHEANLLLCDRRGGENQQEH